MNVNINDACQWLLITRTSLSYQDAVSNMATGYTVHLANTEDLSLAHAGSRC